MFSHNKAIIKMACWPALNPVSRICKHVFVVRHLRKYVAALEDTTLCPLGYLGKGVYEFSQLLSIYGLMKISGRK